MNWTEELLRRAFGAGVDVSISPSGNLFVEPAERLTPALRALLLDHKSEVLQYLQEVQAMTADLIAAAMRCSDHHDDSDQAREDWKRDIAETPPHLRPGLLAHLNATYPPRSKA